MDTCNNDFEIVRGDNENIEVTFTDNDTNLPINITGYTVYFTVNMTKDSIDDEDAVIKKDITDHTDPTNGKTLIQLTSTDTAIAIGKYHYDVQYKDENNQIKTVVIGNINIIQDVTKRP